MSFDGGAEAAAVPRVAIVAAMGVERTSLDRQAPSSTEWSVVQSGPGLERAARAAERALAQGAVALVSWGLVGALDAALAPGTVVLPRRVLCQGDVPRSVDAAWHARLMSLSTVFATSYGDLLTVPAALDSPQSKADAAAATGAAAVDMESVAIARIAANAGVPFVALRVVVDALGDSLPGDAEAWIDERGNRRLPAVWRAVFRPSEWRALLTLAQRYRVASRVLDALAGVVASRGLLGPSVALPRGGS
jgi:adenosylhomocysteine nucleosidase